MEKTMKEDEVRELENEIDSAVDRLFTDKGGPLAGEALGGSPLFEPPSFETEKEVAPIPALEPTPAPAATPRPPIPPSLKSFEEMEAQLLSLEWEINGEKLQRTKEKVLALKGFLRERPDVVSVLNLMAKVLNEMIENEGEIRPPMINFLLDAKETVKLLQKEETEGEIGIYKRLAHGGIEARFNGLEGAKERGAKPASAPKPEKDGDKGMPTAEWDRVEDLLNKFNLLSDRMGGVLDRIDQRVSRLERATEETWKKPSETIPYESKLSPLDITICEIDGQLFGVESDKVCKLFKVPEDFQDKFSNSETVRLKDFVVRVIDLGQVLSIQEKDRRGEIKILVVRDDGEYKGLKIRQVLRRLSARPEMREGCGEHFLGTIQWVYQGRPVEIPILDLGKF